MRTLLVVLLVAVAGAVLTVAVPARAALRVVTTTTDLGDLTRAVGGDRVQVETLCQGTQDPHYVQARPSYMVTLSRADLLIAVGLELEVGWLPLLIQGARNPSINPGSAGYLEGASAVTPIEVPVGPIDRSHGDIHPHGNPHYWLDPDNGRRVAAAIAARLAQLDPDNAAYFEANLEAFEARMDAASARWDAAMAPYRGTPIASYHRTFNYFLERYGLVGVGYLEERPGIPPAPAHLAGLIRRMQAEDVRLIFHESFFDAATSEMVARRSGARVLPLPTSVGGAPGVDSYERLFDHLVESFVAAMIGAGR
jgi:zinc/manganese transport system substrate-binding protein